MAADESPLPGRGVDTPPSARMELAWQRSGLAFAAIGLAILRRELPNVPATPAAAIALIAVGLAAALVAIPYHELFHQRTIQRKTEVLLAAIGAVCLGILALAVSIVA